MLGIVSDRLANVLRVGIASESLPAISAS
jgi:hypothetical protein